MKNTHKNTPEREAAVDEFIALLRGFLVAADECSAVVNNSVVDYVMCEGRAVVLKHGQTTLDLTASIIPD